MEFVPENLLPNIYNLSYEQLDELKELIKSRQNKLYPEYANRIQKDYQELRLRREKKQKEFRENLLPKIKEYLIKNLVPGQSIIKVKGARDGKGIRLFLLFKHEKSSQPQDMYLECRQISQFNSWNKFSESFSVLHEKLGQITEHMIDKVTHIKIDGKFVPIKELI